MAQWRLALPPAHPPARPPRRAVPTGKGVKSGTPTLTAVLSAGTKAWLLLKAALPSALLLGTTGRHQHFTASVARGLRFVLEAADPFQDPFHC